MRSVLASAFVIGWLSAFAAWLAALIYGVKVVRRVRPGVSLWSSRLGYNPFNVIFRTDLLTPEGLKYRQRLCWALALWIALISATLLLGALAGSLR